MSRAKKGRKSAAKGPSSRGTRAGEIEVGSPAYGKIEAVVRLLPTNGDQVPSAWLLHRLKESHGTPRRTAIRWLKQTEAYIPPGHHYPLVKSIRMGRNRLYGFNPTGLMGPQQAEWFLRGAPIGFLREAPKLVEDYAGSGEKMALFWEQSSSALALSMEQILAAAQSVTFAQVHDRMSPSVEVARAQADVLTEVFVKPWVQDLVATLHRFLEVEREKNRTTPRLASGMPGAPMAMESFRRGWSWATGPDGVASKLWVSRMKGPGAGPWGEFLDNVQREQEEALKRFAAQAPEPPEVPSEPA